MSIVEFIITVFVWVDDSLKALFGGCTPWRRRGPRPALSESEVLTMEIVGEFLGYDTDEGIYTYFRWHWLDLFPALAGVHRSEFVRQAARLLWVKERSGCGSICSNRSPMTLGSRSWTASRCMYANSPGPSGVASSWGRPPMAMTSC